MSFLFPAMLAGLAGLLIPIALHLIARHRFPVKDFPSIRLLHREERSNVFALKLVVVPQLLLRLLVLLLLVLAMSRLFVSCGEAARERAGAPRNLLVVIDSSASMRMEARDPRTGKKVALIDLARGQEGAPCAPDRGRARRRGDRRSDLAREPHGPLVRRRQHDGLPRE